jgi:hypothetical protein
VCFQSIGKSILQTIEETHLLLLVGVCVIGTVAGKLHEMSDIFAHRHGSLLQILELLLLELDNTLGHVMRSKSHLKLIPIDVVEFFMSSYIGIPPINCGAYQLVQSQHDLLPVVPLHNLKLLLYNLELVIVSMGSTKCEKVFGLVH